MPASEIIQIMQRLSEEDPETWTPSMVKVYKRGEWRRQGYHEGGGREQKRQYRLKNEFPNLESVIVNLGYDIGNVQLTDSKLRVAIDKPAGSLYIGDYMEDVLEDFRQSIQQLPYDIALRLDSEPNVVILSPELGSKRVENRSMRFLEALKYAFQAQYSR